MRWNTRFSVYRDTHATAVKGGKRSAGGFGNGDRKRWHTRFSVVLGFLLVWVMIVFAAAAAARGIAGNGKLLAGKMLRYAPPETTRLPEGEYAGVGEMTAGYLTGKTETFQYSWTEENGNTFLAFRPHEAEHMADCRELIRLAETLAWWLGGAGLALSAAAFLLRKNRRDTGKGMLWGLGTAAGACAVLLAWGLVNFDGLFITFHLLAFTNDGWLLDPRTDLLIRLMPETLFIDLGTRVLVWMFAAAAAAGIAAFLLRRKNPEENTVNDEIRSIIPPQGGGAEEPGDGADPGPGDQL